MNAFFRSRKGYTLIELLVVVVIMAITAGTLVSFSRIGQDQTNLYIETSKIIDVVLRAKSLAISSYRDPDLGNRTSCAHGIALNLGGDANSFSLTRYLRKQLPDTITSCANMGDFGSKVSSYDRKEAESSTYTLANGIVFDVASTTVSDIAFRPPDPQLYFFGKDDVLLPTGGSGVIVIKDKNGGSKIRIVVGQGGQVSYSFVD